MTSSVRIPPAVFLLLMSLQTAVPAAAQTNRQLRPKEEFATGLAEFVGAIAGTYGDEGIRVRASLHAMRQALAKWDASVSAYEAAVIDELRGAQADRAADLHRAMGIVYLDRGRVQDALSELGAAIERDPTRADVSFLLGVVNSDMNRPAAAAEALLESSRLDPAKPITFYVLAQQLLKIGRPDDAERARQTFVNARRRTLAQTPPTSPVAAPFVQWRLTQDPPGAMPLFAPSQYAEGFGLLTQGRYREALARFEDAVATDPLTADAAGVSERIAQAGAALRQGQLASALGQVQAVIEVAPNLSEAHRMLGTIYWAGGQRADGIAELEAAIRLSPDDERTRMALADALVAEGRFAEAGRALEAAIRVIPGSGQAHFKLAQVSAALDEQAEVARELEEAVRLAPVVGLDYLYRAIGEVHSSERNLVAVIEPYTRRVEVNPNNPDAHVELGETYLDLDRDDEAIAEFLAALMIDPRHTNASAALGKAYLRLGDYADAEAAARRAVALDRTHLEARYTLAAALVRLGRTEEGKQELERYRQMQADAEASRRREYEMTALMRAVAESTGRGAYDEAAARLREAIRIKPDDAALHVSLGLALRNAGRLAEAVEPLERALTLNAGPEVHRHLADLYAALGRPDESQRHRALYEARLRGEGPGR